MTDKLRPTWGYKATGEAQIFVLGEGEDLPQGWSDSPASAEPEPEKTEPEGIPEHWRELHWKQRVKLAKEVSGNPDVTSPDEADAILEAKANG